jgi:Cdc6-like AAA superfamily ATPase
VESAALSKTEAVALKEQISDRAIERAEEDRFGHGDFVARLLAIVSATETPANIAIFGRWGSGKTGIANRLEDELAGRLGINFAYFDAFKFARLPLLRRFLVQLAGSLGGEEEAAKFRRRLYERREEVRVNPLSETARATLWRWAERSLLALAIGIFAFDLLLLIFDAAQRGAAVDLINALLPILLPSALIASLAVLGARFLTATTTSEAPSSEEQFEALFGELLDRFEVGRGPDRKKLVVFVDELDRCSAEEVAETLDGLKTFLDAPGCIFIVAADQKVLEQALSERVRQATPLDLTNPYYSAGSAYLDKIFQYQITLPPLSPGRLTSFALELLEGVGGAWAQVPSKENVVSVLLPVGVRSPRRVKVLLNAFAQTFELVLMRAADGRLSGEVGERAEEVAKLVTLQVEFPLFASDISAHRNLVVLVLAYADARAEGEEATERVLEGLPRHTRDLVEGYGAGRLPTDAALPEDEEGGAKLRERQGSALIDYLRQTSLVLGPRSDLIHLESLHLPSGIEDGLATELEDLALRNLPSQAKDLVGSLEDRSERQRAILRLGELVRESRGIDADNAIRALLAAFPLLGAAQRAVARDLMAAVTRYDERRELGTEELPGALALAIAGDGYRLRHRILARPEALSNPLRRAALEHTLILISSEGPRLGELLIEEIAAEPERASERLLDLKPELRSRLAAAAVDPLREELERLREEFAREELPESEGVDLHVELGKLVGGIAMVAGVLIEEGQQPDAETLLSPVLEPELSEDGIPELTITLEQLASPVGASLSSALGRWLTRRPTQSVLNLAEKIDPKELSDETAGELGSLLARLWREASSAEPGEQKDLEEAMALLGALRHDGARIDEEPLLEEIRASLAIEPASEDQLVARQGDLQRVAHLAEHELIGRPEAGELALACARRLLETVPPSELEASVAEFCETAVSQGAGDADFEERNSVRQSLEASPWAAARSPTTENLVLVLAAAERVRVSGQDPFTFDQIADLSREHRAGFEPGLAAWLEAFRPPPAEAARALRPILGYRLGMRLGAALATYRGRLDRAGRLALVDPVIRNGRHRHIGTAMLREIGIGEAPAEAVATMIADCYRETQNNHERERVMHLWEAMAPSEAAARRVLIRKVFIPLVGENAGAYDIARRHLDLCADPPHGTKGELIEALGKAPDKKRGKQMVARMKQLGIAPPRKGLLGFL